MEDKKNIVCDDIEEMIENTAGTPAPKSMEELEQAMKALMEEEERTMDPCIKRSKELPAYPLDVVRDGSKEYFKALTDAILAITGGNYGSIDYKGYKIYYVDAPVVRSISLEDGHKEYCYEVSFRCDALSTICLEEYHSEDERKAFLDPENELFEKTLALLDADIAELDDGKWVKKKKTLYIREFKGYSSKNLHFRKIEWDEREKDAADTFSLLQGDAFDRAKEYIFTEDDFSVFADVIRRMVFFADYGKKNYLYELQGLVNYIWKPKSKRNRYISQCMHEFGQGDCPDRLVDNCTIYYYLYDPQGWDAVAYLLPILALLDMCSVYAPDDVENHMLKIVDLLPGGGYRERIEKLVEEDRERKEWGGFENDEKDDGSST